MNDPFHVKNPPNINPFLPYEQNLKVCDVSSTHVCLLNKYNVVPNHTLVVTKEYKSQTDFLTKDDFHATWKCLLAYDHSGGSGLAFYNGGGKASGASQRHKHLQIIPLPFSDDNDEIIDGDVNEVQPTFPMLDAYKSGRDLGFLYLYKDLVSIRDESKISVSSVDEISTILHDIYNKMIHSLVPSSCVSLSNNENENEETQLKSKYKFEHDPENNNPFSYNLLLTKDCMVLIPRTSETYKNISTNSIGFAGAMLVRNDDEMNILVEDGPLVTLQHVAVSTSST